MKSLTNCVFIHLVTLACPAGDVTAR